MPPWTSAKVPARKARAGMQNMFSSIDAPSVSLCKGLFHRITDLQGQGKSTIAVASDVTVAFFGTVNVNTSAVAGLSAAAQTRATV